MIRFSPPVRRALLGATAGAALLGLGLSSCSKRITTVDATYAMPEGVPSNDARLVVWYAASVETLAYLDRPPLGPNTVDEFCGRLAPGTEDSLLRSGEFRRRPPGTINGMIFDGTPTTAFQLLRREPPGGGFRKFLDFDSRPFRRWLTSEWELYTFSDPAPSGFSPPSYVARGVIGGNVTTRSPLTNLGVARSPSIADLQYIGVCNPCDSLFTLKWNPVPGASRYWLQVYQFSRAPRAQTLLESAVPSPFNDVQTTDLFVGFTQPPNTTYRLMDSTRTDVSVLVQRPMRYGATYFVRIAAVDSSGHLMAVTRGDYARIQGELEYKLFRMGANIVSPQLRGQVPPRCREDR